VPRINSCYDKDGSKYQILAFSLERKIILVKMERSKIQIYKYLYFLQNSLNLSISIYALLSLEFLYEERIAIVTHRTDGSDTLHC
jgi:hypothetical protein